MSECPAFYCSRCKVAHADECPPQAAPAKSPDWTREPEFPSGPAPTMFRPGGATGRGAQLSMGHPDVVEMPTASGRLWSRYIPKQPVPAKSGNQVPWRSGNIVAVHDPSSSMGSTTKLVFRVTEDSDYPLVELLAANGGMKKDVGGTWRIARDSFYGEHSVVVA